MVADAPVLDALEALREARKQRLAVATIVARTAGLDARNVKGGMSALNNARKHGRTT